MNIISEIEESLFKLFESNISSEIISNNVNMSVDEIESIRNDILRIDDISYKNLIRLYNFAVEQKVNKAFLDKENKKGSCNRINIDIPVRKLYVSWGNYGLFSLGILEEKNKNHELKYKKDKVESLYLANNIFVNSYNEVVYKMDSTKFLCGHYGGGPISFKAFIREYSKINEREIEEIIYKNPIVSYDFYEDKLEAYENVLLENKNDNYKEFIEIYKYNEKLIIKLVNNTIDRRNEINLDECAEKIYIVLNILKDKYKKDINFRQIKYIKNYSSNETKIFSKGLLDKNAIDLILEFDEFEIWMCTGIHSDDIFREEEMIKFLEKLGIKVDVENNLIDTVLRKINRKFNEDGSIEILQII
ncbi:MAG: hypothetical protein E7C47_09610 [Veillonella sp.]|uniref:hypothetical protein n=1 Tax=Veillonella sp. TaxID=1926307 RepID=UPI0029025D96|nr:hypothetical protein [Veillonella sp.]MDU2702383.1 hypothetical protein [Veillonella sp.]